MRDEARKCVYGPVKSWRLGNSLGIDLLFVDSICSFACVYCQLGKINRLTTKRGIFVPTARVMGDLSSSDWKDADVITFSGSGEPTLAANLGEAIAEIRRATHKPIAVLTNSSLLGDTAVRRELSFADIVFCKLDAWGDDSLRRIDRPAAGIELDSIISGIRAFRNDFSGTLAIQTMLLSRPANNELREFSGILKSISPDEVQVNLPLRPIPDEWIPESRGNLPIDAPAHRLRTISPEAAAGIGRQIGQLTGLRVITPFDEQAA